MGVKHVQLHIICPTDWTGGVGKPIKAYRQLSKAEKEKQRLDKKTTHPHVIIKAPLIVT